MRLSDDAPVRVSISPISKSLGVAGAAGATVAGAAVACGNTTGTVVGAGAAAVGAAVGAAQPATLRVINTKKIVRLISLFHRVFMQFSSYDLLGNWKDLCKILHQF